MIKSPQTANFDLGPRFRFGFPNQPQREPKKLPFGWKHVLARVAKRLGVAHGPRVTLLASVDRQNPTPVRMDEAWELFIHSMSLH